jgi:hypothetical protein
MEEVTFRLESSNDKFVENPINFNKDFVFFENYDPFSKKNANRFFRFGIVDLRS